MRPVLRVRPKLHSVGPLFPKPSRQLLECLGWIEPAKRRSVTTRATGTQKRESRVSKVLKEQVDTVDSESSHNKASFRLDAVLQDVLRLLDSHKPPKEEEILESLKTCKMLAGYFQRAGDHLGDSMQNNPETPAMNLLFLDEGGSDPKKHQQMASTVAAAMRENSIRKLSETAYTILKDPKIFLTPPILKSYVDLQSLLGRPETFAEALKLFANKPIPMEDTSPIEYQPANPNRASSAVPLAIGNAALDAAIQARILPLCLDIVDVSVCTTAYRRYKVLKQALLPITTIAAAPLAAYAVARRFSDLQDTMSTQIATNTAFAGIMSYVFFTGTIGYVALTTSNDKMDRVVWATGTPLKDRWLREDERAMMDKIAGAWGFKEEWRRGDEEGPEWSALKELVGLRGMVLDKVELMEGME